jgi:hypothetical protein
MTCPKGQHLWHPPERKIQPGEVETRVTGVDGSIPIAITARLKHRINDAGLCGDYTPFELADGGKICNIPTFAPDIGARDWIQDEPCRFLEVPGWNEEREHYCHLSSVHTDSHDGCDRWGSSCAYCHSNGSNFDAGWFSVDTTCCED